MTIKPLPNNQGCIAAERSDTSKQQGLIYVLINPCMTGLVKIGVTTRTAEERAREISVGTGVPSAYVVAYEEDFSDCEEAERIIHKRLDAHRFNQGREFFRISVKDAIRAVAALANEFREQDRVTAEAALRAIKIPAIEREAPKHGQWSAMTSDVSCPRCSTHYTITLKRGERQAACPSCRFVATLAIRW